MDPALLKDREAFKARALKLPTVESSKRKFQGADPSKSSKKAKTPSKAPAPTSQFDYKSASGTSQFKFGILAKIVKFMKQRHMVGDTHALNIEEILDETNQLDIPQRHKHWLSTEALGNNPKIEVVEMTRYKFKPKYEVANRKSLLRLLDKNDQRGMGGILMEDIEESLPNSHKAFKVLGDHIIFATRLNDKKKVLFYNDKSTNFTVDEDISKLWRSATVEGVDETKIEEYLTRVGITSMQDMAGRAPVAQKRKKGGKKKPMSQLKTNNAHMGDVLKDYSELKK